MFRRQGETYDEYEKRIMRTADILFPTMKDKERIFASAEPAGGSGHDKA